MVTPLVEEEPEPEPQPVNGSVLTHCKNLPNPHHFDYHTHVLYLDDVHRANDHQQANGLTEEFPPKATAAPRPANIHPDSDLDR